MRTFCPHAVTTMLCLCSALFLVSCNVQKLAPKTEEKAFQTDIPKFKSIIRLWPSHHTDSVLLCQMLDAFRKFPDACDEVWLCVAFNSFDLDYHRQQAQLMKRAAVAFRKLGIKASMQSVVLGHPENMADTSQPTIIEWQPIMSLGGKYGRNQSCPRQQAYLERVSDIQAIYAQEVQPSSYMLDDDLRLTNHTPADAICFCDTCLRLFNEQHGFSFTRPTLHEALVTNAGNGDIRRKWIRFSQESLAGVARIISRKIHQVSPTTQMGLQHPNFHTQLLEGYDWNPIFQAMEEETGIIPASRPGHGFYSDAAPRGMLEKAYGIARQIRRLNTNITDISPEIEGYLHKATGKSPQGICTETLLYMSLGGTQMSYAIVCSGQEPVEWYADTYFKFLSRHHRTFLEYTSFNRGTQPGGLDAYISPHHVLRHLEPGEGPWDWCRTDANSHIHSLATLGIPFSPDGDYTTATYMDQETVMGTPDDELEEILHSRNLFIDLPTWHTIQSRCSDLKFTTLEMPKNLQPAATLAEDAMLGLSAPASHIQPQCFLSPSGKRIAVVPSFSTDINNAERLHLLRIADWASNGKLPVFVEQPAQGVVVPRVTPDGTLRSVAYLNCTISSQEYVRLRLRGCPRGEHTHAVWKIAGQPDVRLRTEWHSGEMLVTLPAVPGWHIGWIALE